MYSAGEEFERYNEENELESFTCIANVNADGKEYLVCDDETGEKRIFLYDSIEEELKDLDEDEQERILEIWDEEYYGYDKDYMYWNEDFGEYDKEGDFEEKIDENDFGILDGEDDEFLEVDVEDDDDEEIDEDLDEFLDEFLDE